MWNVLTRCLIKFANHADVKYGQPMSTYDFIKAGLDNEKIKRGDGLADVQTESSPKRYKRTLPSNICSPDRSPQVKIEIVEASYSINPVGKIANTSLPSSNLFTAINSKLCQYTRSILVRLLPF